MRQRFEQQMSLRTTAIADVQLPLKSRDELPPILMALQYIFITPELNEKVFALLENKVCSGKKKTGRKGMDLWHILVLAVVRNGCGSNWDSLALDANHHTLVRKIMGVHGTEFLGEEGEQFTYQSIVDNVKLIDEVLLQQINQLIVDAGHQLVKKKEVELLSLKTDSYALETNVHFPTDLNLLWDSLRKCLDIIDKVKVLSALEGWRKINHIRKTLKSLFRATSQKVFKGKDEHQKKQFVKQYLEQARLLENRVATLITTTVAISYNDDQIMRHIVALEAYKKYVTKFTDQIERRLLKGEVIPAEEKIFSIFEPHTEWLTKGKLNRKVELGHLLLITTDQYQFIVDYKVLDRQRDAQQVGPLCARLKDNLGSKKIYSHSFDKGFWSKENLEKLEAENIGQVVLPKRGRYSKEDKKREGGNLFKKLRKAHSAVESNINMLEHHGLNRCMDKGLQGFKRCVGLSVLAYNLHILGNVLKAKELEASEKRKKVRLSLAA